MVLHIFTVFEITNNRSFVHNIEIRLSSARLADVQEHIAFMHLIFFNYGSDIHCYFLHFVFQWMPELRRFAPNVPIVLVGTKLGKQELIQNIVLLLVMVL